MLQDIEEYYWIKAEKKKPLYRGFSKVLANVFVRILEYLVFTRDRRITNEHLLKLIMQIYTAVLCFFIDADS